MRRRINIADRVINLSIHVNILPPLAGCCIIRDEAIIGWELDLNYDPTQVSWDSVNVGPIWTPISGDGDGLGGTYMSPMQPPTGIWGQNILLATLGFTCLEVGISSLGLSADALEGFLLDPNLGQGMFANWCYTPAQVTQTPEPGTVLLLGSGLIGLAGIGRRKLKKNS